MELIRSEVFPMDIEHFRVLMQRLETQYEVSHASAGGKKMLFGERPREPLRGSWKVFVPSFYINISFAPRLPALPFNKVVLVEDSTGVHLKEASLHATPCAGIEAYEQANGTLKVDFYDGYNPAMPEYDCPAIGAAFQELCEVIVREAQAASDGQITPQADSGAVAEQATAAVDKGDKKPGPMDTKGVDFLLVTALEEERDAVLDKLPGYQKLPPFKDDIRTYFQAQLPMTFSDGETGNYRVIVMPLLGMGRVQAATATADAITRWHPRYIMLVGIAGGVAARGVSIGDILIADQIVDYELQELTPQGPQVRWEVQRAHPRLLNACHNFMGESWQELLRIERPARSKPKRHTGPIASGDKVIAFGDILERYREVWPKLIGVEMEAAGVATAAFQSSEPPGFFMVRCVSDLADENKGSADVEKWRSYACDAAASFAIALLKSGPVHLLDRGPEQL